MLSYLDTDVILIEGGKHEIDFFAKGRSGKRR